MARATLYVCRDCLAPAGAESALAAVGLALGAAGLADDVVVSPAPCLDSCGRPVAIALDGVGMASYVFAGVDLATDAADIASACAAYLAAPGGWIEDARPCGRLRFLLRTRLPPRREA